jgi:hypothetical protein
MSDIVLPPFEGFPSISRLKRGCVITEKIDGTNAQVYVGEDGLVLAGSRNRWITPEDDNFGFAAWVAEHADELRTGLGPGRHFGEWWGAGIQRRYGLTEKRFSLFNSGRWKEGDNCPPCCHVVPVLYDGPFTTSAVDITLDALVLGGSVAAPGFPNPEGVVVYMTAARTTYKVTLGDDGHKGAVAA